MQAKTPETIDVKYIKCVKCGKYNKPEISSVGEITYPDKCQNRLCRIIRYAGQKDKRKSDKSKKWGKELYEYSTRKNGTPPNPNRFKKPKIVIASLYNRK